MEKNVLSYKAKLKFTAVNFFIKLVPGKIMLAWSMLKDIVLIFCYLASTNFFRLWRKHSTRDEILKYIEHATTFSKQFRNNWDSQKHLEIDEILKKHWTINDFSQTFNQRWHSQIYWACHNILENNLKIAEILKKCWARDEILKDI
jgi:hypothetical protein